MYPHLQKEDDEHKLELPSSPWTYENGSLNPHLESSNARRRRPKPKVKGPVSNVPPYHPDYVPPSQESDGDNYPVGDSSEDDYEEDDEEMQNKPRRLVRRGSEGYEVHTIDREKMLKQWIEATVEDPERYHHYVPEPPSASESEDEDIPLATKISTDSVVPSS